MIIFRATVLLTLLFIYDNAISNNYTEYLSALSGPNTAVIVVGMSSHQMLQQPGSESTAVAISAITTKVSDMGGMVVCVTDHPMKSGWHCPSSVIQDQLRRSSHGRRYAEITSNDMSTFFDTGLMDLLNQNNINHVVVTGGYTENCIRFTVIDALEKNLGVSLLFNSVSTIQSGIYFYDQLGSNEKRQVEAEAFFKLVERLKRSEHFNRLTVVCAPSRSDSRKDRHDSEGASGFGPGHTGHTGMLLHSL